MTMNRNDSDRLLKKAHFRSSSSLKSAPITTSHGFASIIQQENRSEQRDLSKLTETLTDYILECCTLDAHNRIQEQQIEWLDNNINRNVSTIEHLFQTEIQSNRQLIDNNQRIKFNLKKQFEDIQQTTTANQEYYQQILAKRNAINKDLLIYQQQLAQTRAESEFIRNRMQLYNEEIQYYKLKNSLLKNRIEKFQIDINDDLFSRQVLQMEYETLENEKLTNEDIHLISIEDLRLSIQQIVILQPSTYFREQLIHQIRQMRIEYNQKLEIYRDELHRQFELTKEKYSIIHFDENLLNKYEQKFDEYRRENNEIEQEISSIRSSFDQLENQMKILADNIEQIQQDTDIIDNSQRKLNYLHEILQTKQQQLNEAIRIRNQLKEQIEFYRNKIKQPKKSILRQSQSTIEKDCQLLNHLFQQININTTSLIDILCHRNNTQRIQIRDTFKNLYNQNLGNLIDKKISGNAKKFLKLLLLSPVEFDCYEFRRILRTNYFDENIVIELLLSRSNKHIRNLLQTYSKLFKNPLKQDIVENSSKQFFINLLEINRSEGIIINQNEIINDAKYLFTTSSKWKKDGSSFVQLIAKRSNEQLKKIFDVYQRFSNIDIEQTIKIDTDLSLSRTLMAIIRIVRNQPRFFAYQLRKSLRDSKMNEDHLNRIIITRCEIDMIEIQSEYEKISKYTFYDQIQIDTQGDYKRAISELIHVNLPKKTQRTSSESDVSQTNGQFDRNNQAKSNTLSRLETTREYLSIDE